MCVFFFTFYLALLCTVYKILDTCIYRIIHENYYMCIKAIASKGAARVLVLKFNES